jgi:hypothetical protein
MCCVSHTNELATLRQFYFIGIATQTTDATGPSEQYCQPQIMALNGCCRDCHGRTICIQHVRLQLNIHIHRVKYSIILPLYNILLASDQIEIVNLTLSHDVFYTFTVKCRVDKF